MKAIKLTAVDVCAVSGYARDQLRGTLDGLPPYAEQKTSARVAREFLHKDLIVLSVVFVLDIQFNIRRPGIALIIESLIKTLSGPKAVNREARLLITFNPPSVRYLNKQEPIQSGILVALGPIFERIDAYMAGNPINASRDMELNFGPNLVTGKKKVAKV